MQKLLTLTEDRDHPESWHIAADSGLPICGAQSSGLGWQLPDEKFVQMYLCLNCWSKIAVGFPAMLAVLTESIGIPANADFAADLETIAYAEEDRHFDFPLADALRAKAGAIRAALAGVGGGAK